MLASFLLAAGFGPARAQNVFPSFDRGQPIDDLKLADLATTQVFALADLNHDGFADIATAGFDPDDDPAVIVLLNDRGGGFGGPVYFVDEEVDELDEPIALEVADVGSPVESEPFGGPDGNLDIVVLDASAELLFVLWGDGAGGFRFSAEAERLDLTDFVEGDLVGLSAGDFDGENGSDIVVLDSGSSEEGQVIFFCNRPRAPFLSCDTSLQATGGEGPIAVAAGDFDGSGTTDVVALNSAPGTGNLVVFRGDGRGNFSLASGSPVPLARPDVTHLTAARFNGDGITDLAVSYIEELGGDSVQVFFGGNRLIPRRVTEGVALAPQALASGDFDGDGIGDLVAAQGSPQNESFVMLGNGEGGFGGVATSQGVLTGPAIAVRVADLDRDGDDDFVVAREHRTGFRIALNARIRPTPTPSETRPTLTPTATGTEAVPTSTVAAPTFTPTPPSTPTRTSDAFTPTPILTSTATPGRQPLEPTNEDDGCAIVRTRDGGSGSRLPLLAGAIPWLAGLFRRWARRRSDLTEPGTPFATASPSHPLDDRRDAHADPDAHGA